MWKKIVLCVAIILLLGATVEVSYFAVKSQPKVSYINEAMEEYMESGSWNGETILEAFPEDSAEAFFSKAMTYYAEGNVEEAEIYFHEAEKRSGEDAALPAYVNIYLNECLIAKTGDGSVTYAEAALDAMEKCPELTNQLYWVWTLVYPFAENEITTKTASSLIQRYLEKAETLTQDELLELESYEAVIKNLTGEYSESIMLFYDILAKAQDLPQSYSVISTKSTCINYIAEMYYSYEDYVRAKEFYLELLEQSVDDPYENASLKYTAYVNMGNIYLKQKDYEKAKKVIEETETILPYLNENIAAEVRAYGYNVLASMELEQGNVWSAAEYYKECEAFLEREQTGTFFGTEVYFKMTQCRILAAQGRTEQAEKILTQILDKKFIESQAVYEAQELLAEIYRMEGKTEQYYKEQVSLLKMQNTRIKQYQLDYCDAIDYYDQLVSLRKEHNLSLHKNEVLGFVLTAVLILLVLIIRISIGRYHDSITDALSGLYNRKQLDKEITFYDKNSYKFISYGLIMMDIDYFKRYNDTYGHAAGDEVIRRVAGVIKKSVRKQDVAIRYGGEEFLVLLREINSSTIESIAERIRISVQEEKIIHEASDVSEYVSISLGGFYIERTNNIRLTDAIKEADKALYESKQTGKNKVTVR